MVDEKGEGNIPTHQVDALFTLPPKEKLTRKDPTVIVQAYIDAGYLAPLNFENSSAANIAKTIISNADKLTKPITVNAKKNNGNETATNIPGYEVPELTGKKIRTHFEGQNPEYVLDLEIGSGAEGIFLGAHVDKNYPAPEFTIGIKVFTDLSGARSKNGIDTPTMMAIHSHDKPPVLPRFFGVSSIEYQGEKSDCIIMERLGEMSLSDLTHDPDYIPNETSVLGSMIPLFTFLTSTEEQENYLLDWKAKDIRVDTYNLLGTNVMPYYRLVEFGHSNLKNSEEKPEKVQKSLHNLAAITILATTKNFDDLDAFYRRDPDTRDYKNAVHDLYQQASFQKLSPPLRYVILKSLGVMPEKYETVASFSADMNLIYLSQVIGTDTDLGTQAIYNTKIADGVSDELLGEELKDAWKKQVQKNERLVKLMEESAKSPEPENEQERNIRLNQKGYALNVGLAADLSIGRIDDNEYARLVDEINNYLAERPEDTFVAALKHRARLLKTVTESGITTANAKIHDSFGKYCESLVDNTYQPRENFSEQKVEGRFMTLSYLRDMIQRVLEADAANKN